MTAIIIEAASEADFVAVHALRTRMKAWDIAMSAAVGKTAADVVSAYYKDDAATLRRRYTAPGARMFLAWSGQTPLGTFGFSGLQTGVAEVEKFYVAEEARGQGLGRALITRVLASLPSQGYRRACLETAHFMTAAIAQYRAAGFQPCPPFRPGLDGLSVFMSRDL